MSIYFGAATDEDLISELQHRGYVVTELPIIPVGGWSHICRDGETHTTHNYECPHNCGARYAPNA